MLEDPQIVNGLQTSTEVFRHFCENSLNAFQGRAESPTASLRQRTVSPTFRPAHHYRRAHNGG